MDKSGNGYAVIRFLPAPTGEDLPWVKLWNHAFQGPTGQWYIENSLTTLGKNDPVSNTTPNFGTLVLRLIRRSIVNRSVSCNTIPTFTLSLILRTSRMRVKFSLSLW